MTSITEIPPNERLQYRVLTVLSLVAIVATGILSLYQDPFFQAYFESIDPLLAMVLVAGLGVVSLGFLGEKKTWRHSRLTRAHGFRSHRPR